MTVWFEVSLTSGLINKVEVEKFNNKSVWVKAGYNYIRRSPRTSHFTEYHPTFEEAQKAGRKSLLAHIEKAEKIFNQTTKRLAYLDSLQAGSLEEPPKYDTPLFGLQKEILADIDIEVTRK